MKNYHFGRAAKAVTTGILYFLFASMSFAQTPTYKDLVVDNPNAEADMKVIADF